MTAPIPGSDKAGLRAWARNIRNASNPPMLWPLLAALPEFQRASHVLLYAAMKSEIDVLPLAELPGRRYYLPRCAEERRLAVHGYPCPLETSRFGIPEPLASDPEVDPMILDFVVVPGLAFTASGERLGQGGGYYDRFLSRLSPSCIAVGVVPATLLVATLPTDPWDIPVRLVVTERGVAKPVTA
jgi:5-formyltetrahydrofolate cyclo-ligase